MILKSVSSDSQKGSRSYQEDYLLTASYEQGTFLAVFDGHGGSETAQTAFEEVPGYFTDEIGNPEASPATALANTVKRIVERTRGDLSGSTLSLAFVAGDTVTCAVMGDSPVIVKDAEGKIVISPDHNVRTNETEAQAVRDRGGFVINGYAYQNRFEVGLQMARALGDVGLDRVLSREPEIYEVKLGVDSFVIVASDGVFDPGHYGFREAAEAVIALVAGGADAKVIVNRAVKLKTGDNASAIVAVFEKDAEDENADNDNQAPLAS